MTIPRKGSRKIIVDNVPYRWTVRSKPSYAQALAESPLTFAVDCEDNGSCTLLVKLEAARPDNWVGSESMVVTPSLVERSIREALSKGWKPQEKGGAYVLDTSLLNLPLHTDTQAG